MGYWLLFLFASLALAHECAQNCTIVGNATKDQCVYYEQNMDWLPTAYVKSATCACTGAKGLWDDGWNSPTSHCVRNFLLAGHRAINDTFKAEMRAKKEKYCVPAICNPEYLFWIEKNWVPIAYKVHVDAYRHCCCPKGPAPFWSWQALMLNYEGIVGCPLIVTAIEGFGKCGCQGW
eukprot:TRINITY_DN6356_c0_g1_i1.p1 TRINITY_DN6356_c0_g1~~TRINITY_DN6356_c0_g1_i1.p1  ORF type:complete len:177 (-),score=26.40 TRINITY_DN6356_c0_g1_i1:17-547(-)